MLEYNLKKLKNTEALINSLILLNLSLVGFGLATDHFWHLKKLILLWGICYSRLKFCIGHWICCWIYLSWLLLFPLTVPSVFLSAVQFGLLQRNFMNHTILLLNQCLKCCRENLLVFSTFRQVMSIIFDNYLEVQWSLVQQSLTQ